MSMEQGSISFTSSLARVTRTRSMETVVAVPLPPPNQAEMDELRMQVVKSHVETVGGRIEPATGMAAAMEKNRLEQEAVQVALLRQQEDLVRQQDELKRPMANQDKATAEHREMLRQASGAMRQQHYTVEELSKVRRDSERWGLFAEGANQR
ncbi:hypothetical protein DYB37_010224 [Aphanomyces astaci]|uniref:Uncharacterized protein n=1 Tax=Aphanomyces astaci TaxID=112090 RepID=A0A3R7B623_APHAT|nr:hypothetical protein DYB37_010224 [Aphanomyces astaci]